MKLGLQSTLFWLVIFGVSLDAAANPAVTNVIASQRTDGTGIVDVYYTLSGVANTAYVEVTFSDNNGANWNVIPTPSFLTGAIGSGIGNGTHQIAWDAPRDVAQVSWPSARARVTATELGNTININLPGGVPIEMVEIPAGTFQMGTGYDPPWHTSGVESPVHTVTLNYSFHMSKFEVTQAQWFAVMNGFPQSQPSANANLPVVYVSWNDIQTFLTALNGLGIGTYRLPSEAEWEYACRAGTTTRWSHGNEETGLENYAWYSANNTPNAAKVVGGKLPNPFGLYDMHGNVREWVQDWYHSSYTGAPSDGSAWEDPVGTYRVVRGGYWGRTATNVRSAYRYLYTPSYRNINYGFRLLRE